MSLTLSSRELSLLANALAITAAPLAFTRTSDWRRAVRHAIEPLLGADKSVSGLGIGSELFLESPDDDARAWQVYAESGFADERGDRRIGRRGPEVASMDMVHDVPGLRRSELYNEFFRPYSMFHPVSIQIFMAGSPVPACISFFHVTERARPFEERAVAILELVRPVFRASVELLAGLNGTRGGPTLSEFIDALPDAAALCTASGELLHESPSLVRLLATEPLAWRVRSAITASARALVGTGALEATKSTASPVDAPVAFEVRGARTRYAVRGSLLALTPALARDAMTIVTVFAALPSTLSDADLQDRFALTAREVEVARLLAVGRSAREVAAALGISYFTARHHIEHLLVKLGVRTRAAVAAAIAVAGED
jgi:DNA-binding CsgD family transcriptional regulator